ncbi:ABC transporter substrate-binding protein [Halalkalibacter flavus]|uniref:ABC transporter substrate-binding protein n=1 Tax=Halalkalibacter flavus TaxID=3090668 RepID=UPI002FC880CB
MKKTSLLNSLLLLLFCIMLVACSSNETQEEVTGETEVNSNSEDVTLTIAVGNNPQMPALEKLSKEYTEETGVKVDFALIPENDLRQTLTNHATIGGGQYDIVQIGSYEMAFWADNGWLEDLEPYFEKMSDEELAEYDREDLLPPVKQSLTIDEKQYGLPFYAEASMMYYNTEVFEKAGIEIPTNPTWDEIYEIATQLHDPANNQYGITMRGQPGWGMNGAVFGSMIHAFGSRWVDENWDVQFTKDPNMARAFEMYKKLLVDAGQPNIVSTGYAEASQLFMEGNAAMFYDATSLAEGFNNSESKVYGKFEMGLAPTDVKIDNTGWIWVWALGIDPNSKHKQEAFDFITWATSKEYIERVAEDSGWGTVPPGTRQSTYENKDYMAETPYASDVLNSLNTIKYDEPSVDPVPYVGIQYVGIPEFAEFGTQVSEYLAEYVSGATTLEEALEKSQNAVETAIANGGYK